jgi:hypothetical protein
LDDKVAMLSTDTNTLSYVNPTEKQEYSYSGTMYRFNGSHFDLVVTPSHSVFVRKRNREQWELLPASTVSRLDEFNRSCLWNGVDQSIFSLPPYEYSNHNQYNKSNSGELNISMRDWLKFFGLWIAEGHLIENGIAITQLIKRRGVTEIVSQLPFYSKWYGKDLRITNMRLKNYFSRFGHSHDKYIPKEFKNLSKEHLQCLLDGLMLGDGYKNSFGGLSYYTVSKKLADDVQEIMLKLGYGVMIRKRNGRQSQINGRIIKGGIQYEVLGTLHHNTPQVRRIEKIEYKGKVYCCTVPSHIILVRRSGKTVWSGNSGTSGVVTLRQGKSFIGIDVNPSYVEMAKRRLNFSKNNPFVKFEYLKL